MSKKPKDGITRMNCNPHGRPGYPNMIKAKCYDCSPESGDCGVPSCPLYAASPKNKSGGNGDLGWLVQDEFNYGKREVVHLVNNGTVLKTFHRRDYYPEEYGED